ncbi:MULTISPECIES: anti-sigma factor antagonist [Streptomyces]|uniref:anti-sigma factor antagonist n=1 Tax=Streptomyces TaxID=1883 RepID=UPI000FFEDC71|nr:MULTISPECIES: anti-sigma factor antagonist [Streptomyces]NDK29221.1 anti-sigma factor antagonist [Streptomyces sp. TR1341]WSI89395.1 anti-sigma factor antagonist [Streptomyces murinus]WUD11062.1 anti-sigma factor antagonist [Streptomyces murinus]
MRREPVSLTRHLRVYAYRAYTVLEFRGEIDIIAADEILPLLDRITGRPGARVVLDLRPVEFFDCSGLRLLYRARARILGHDGQVHLVCTHPLTLRVLRVTGLSRLLPPHATTDAALAGAGSASGAR